LPAENSEDFACAGNCEEKMTRTEELARVFKVLSVESRVRIVQLLKSKVLCVNALAKLLDMSPAAVSQHLRILRDAGVVRPEKRGYFVHYRLDEETLRAWRDLADGFFSETGQSIPLVELNAIKEECHE
jgi:DNA-binding transcriptional ArsR family regulator